jgi:hypothetical protein
MKTNAKSRRNFLMAAGIGGAGAVAAVATGRKPRVAGEKTASAQQGDGYRPTEHILKYYETTKV